MRLRFKIFSSMVLSWETLMQEASDFASSIGQERVVSISHSAERGEFMSTGTVVVWYWA